MFDILPEIKTWVTQNKPFALATVIKTWGSSPRPVGSALAVTGDMEMAGSVSGGCVEGAVMKKAQENPAERSAPATQVRRHRRGSMGGRVVMRRRHTSLDGTVPGLR